MMIPLWQDQCLVYAVACYETDNRDRILGLLTCLPGADNATCSRWVISWIMGAGGTIRGTITVDGYPKDQATFNRVSGYVEQVLSSTGVCHWCMLFEQA